MEVNRDPEKAMYTVSLLGKPSGRSPSPMADPIVNCSAEQSNDESGQKTDPRDISQWPITPDILQIRQRNETNGGKSKKLGVTWQNLTVKGISSDALYNENVLSQFNPFGKGNKSPPLKTIIDNSSGCVKPGEMLLVLGNPGAGCTTLLSVLSNHRNGFAEITGDVSFGSMTSQEAKQYRGQIIMNTEEEIFFPALSVGDTIDFATRLKVPFHLPPDIKNEEEYAQIYKGFLLKSLGITHTKDTKVGDEFIRGVSGGERKRVSILECLATRGSVFSWDNSTRGLDASTALDWTKAMRAMTDILGLTTIASLYQAGNGIYEQFDKILILDNGKQIFYGPRDEAVPYMEDLGFLCDPAANKSDFLTSVSAPAQVVHQSAESESLQDANPWLRMTCWARYLAGVHFQDMLDVVATPDPELVDPVSQATQRVWDAMAQLARRSQRTVQHCGHGIRMAAASTMPNQTPYQLLWAYMDEKSIQEHVQPWQ
ncbi:P-loop containing nucleoside triphosphate hydrolase protein [Aspergillus falconensis]